MKIPLRIVVPIVIALGTSGAVAVFFLWQIHSSIRTIESSFRSQGDTTNLLKKILPSRAETQFDSRSLSQALMELRQGEIFELKGEWKQAQDHYEKSVSTGGGVPALRKLASMQLQRREYDNAKKTIAALRDANPNGGDTVLLLGLLALRSGDARGAASIFGKTPDSPESQYGAALVAISQGDHETARKELMLAAGNSDATVKTYAKTILAAYDEFALFPNGQDIHLLTLVARALAQVNECETALPLLESVILKQERYRDAWIVKGYCEFTSERLKDALTSLEEAYSLDPEKAETQYFLARTHAALGDPQNAVTFLQYALLNGFMPERDARELLIRYAEELGNTDIALEQLKILTDAKDSDLKAYEQYVDLALTSGNHASDALASAKKALAKWPSDAATLALAAKAAFAAGKPDDAAKYLLSAQKIDPKNPKVMEVEEVMRNGTAK